MKFPCRLLKYSAFLLTCGILTLSASAVDDYMVIDVSAGYGQSYPVSYYDSLPLPVTDDSYKTDKIVLKKISAGSFIMGSPTNEVGRPQINPNEDLHQVTLTQDYYMGVYEITEYQWSKVKYFSSFTMKPAVDSTVKMDNILTLADSFIALVNSGADLGALSVDLPSEAQWEYACRAGTQTSYSYGSDVNQLQDYAWYFGYDGSVHEVGLKTPNPWGLYDMHGNAAEFCRDAYNANLETNAVTDPEYVSGAGDRVEKSGAYDRQAADNRSAFRNSVGNGGTYRTGFRICVTLPPPPPTYDLTVVNGSGDGSYTNAHMQEIVADAPPQWFEFDQWTGAVANVDDIYAPTTTITIVAADVTVGATYKPVMFDIAVSNGTAAVYSATNGQIVAIYADPPPSETNIFYRWEGDVAGVADISVMTTTVTIAGADVDLTAVYRDAPYTLTVNGGTGGEGYHFEGEVVQISAAAPGQYHTFWWTGDTSTLADPEAWNTSLIMPGNNAEVTATYPDIKYNLIVVNGTGSGSYTNGERVAVNTLQPPSDLHLFDRWSGDSAYLDNFMMESTVFTIHAADALIAPLYKPVAAVQGEYMVANLIYSGSRIDVSYMDAIPAGGWDNTYKDTKMAFKRIMPGTYQMGTGSVPDEDIHTVTLTEAFYIGVFEVTQGQWDNVVGGFPADYTGTGRDYHPVENISYDDIRGATNGRDWPSDADVDASSFVGVMRTKTGSDGFDLPTEAQWEYACRAGTTGDWYVDSSEVFDVAVVSVYGQDPLENSAEVGSLAPNNWGLYDTHGNVFEWCLDWFHGTGLGTAPQIDPVGYINPNTGIYYNQRLKRGGSFELVANPVSKSGWRGGQITNGDSFHTGFRMINAVGVPHTLTIVDSKVNTGGTFYYRAKIGISAVDKPPQTFDHWGVEPEGAFAGALFNANDRDTIITMPGQTITVRAYYR